MGMQLRELLNREDVPSIVVGGISSDSRSVRPGDLFIAYKGGAFDGHDFVAEAVKRGAVAVCAERAKSMSCAIPWIHIEDIERSRGSLAAKFYGYPAHSMHVAGVTGTNGKSSVAYGSACLLEATASVGTLGWGKPPGLCPSSLTTVDPIAMQANFSELLKRGIRQAVLEVSSHALDQGRVNDIDISCAVFTNLSRDHLDYHESMKDYSDAKFKLFERPELRCGIVNVDDPLGSRISRHLTNRNVECLKYGVAQDADLRWTNVEYASNGIRGTWLGHWGNTDFYIPYVGEMYVANAAAMLLVANYFGMEFQDAVERMETTPQIPGRMEFFFECGLPSTVLDYAHTPDALRSALNAVRSHTSDRIVCVFGCGGDRDKGKRPEMARIAQELADFVVVTSDNPRNEPPMDIINEICEGFEVSAQFFVQPDRAKAIEFAVSHAQSGDTVLVAGKGHERYQEIGNVRLPYSDRAAIQRVFGVRA